MRELFPATAHLHRMRGMIQLIAEHSGNAGISALANETNENIDSLLPVIDACRMFGLCSIRKGTVYLTASGKSLTPKNVYAIVRQHIATIEPFRSVVNMLKQGGMTTAQIAAELNRRGIVIYNPETHNQITAVKSLLLGWTVTTKVLKHDHKTDNWMLT